MHILLFFIDGLGLGDNDAVVNPLVTARMPVMRSLLGGQSLTLDAGNVRTKHTILIPVDATLGIAGLPQSATGQTALFTGINAPAIMGGHLHAFPTPRLRAMLAERSVLKQVKEIGGHVVAANAYRPDYFALSAQQRRRHSASTLAALAAGLSLNLDLERLRDGQAVYHDLSNAYLQGLGYHIACITPEQAGKNLATLIKGHHFTLFEYFQTDRAGHKQDRPWSEEILENVDRCLASLLTEVDLRKTLIIIASDHGNIEDLRVKTHTCNPVPVLLIGKGREYAAQRIRAITDITPVIVELLQTRLKEGGE